MNRRDLIKLIGGATAWPVTARAQQGAMPVVGWLGSGSPDTFADAVAAFRKGLSEAGYVEGKTVAIDYRWADDHYDRLPTMAADLVKRRVSVIAAIGNQRPALAAKAATSTIPVVFVMGADPIGTGLVSSLSRPGGNITGLTNLSGLLIAKRVQLLRDLIPSAMVFGILRNPDNNVDGGPAVTEARNAVRALGGTTQIANARSDADFEPAFADLKQRRVDAVAVLPDSLFFDRCEELAAVALRYAMPTISPWKESVRAGGLMSYGTDMAENDRQAGVYAGRILRGEKPADLPVVQATKFELVINVKTAKAVGLTISRDIQLIADELIE